MHVVLPIKRFSQAKTRLSEVLLPEQRRDLSAAMVEAILGEVSRTEFVTRVLLASSEPEVAAYAQQFGFEYLPDDRDDVGLNHVVDRATVYLVEQGASDVGVVLGDLPLFSSFEFSRIIRRHRKGSVRQMTITPDRHGLGTNVRLCRPGNLVPARYGRSSSFAHQAAAIKANADIQVVRSETLGLDIDVPDDCIEVVNLHQATTGARPTKAVSMLANWFRWAPKSGVLQCS